MIKYLNRFTVDCQFQCHVVGHSGVQGRGACGEELRPPASSHVNEGLGPLQPIHSDVITVNARGWPAAGPTLPVSSPDLSNLSQGCGWTSPCGSYYYGKRYLSNSHQGTLENQGLLLTSSEGTQACQGHTVRSWQGGGRGEGGEREKPEICLIGVEGGGPGFLRFMLCW